jgi:hypothetical protein
MIFLLFGVGLFVAGALVTCLDKLLSTLVGR